MTLAPPSFYLPSPVSGVSGASLHPCPMPTVPPTPPNTCHPPVVDGVCPGEAENQVPLVDSSVTPIAVAPGRMLGLCQATNWTRSLCWGPSSVLAAALMRPAPRWLGRYLLILSGCVPLRPRSPPLPKWETTSTLLLASRSLAPSLACGWSLINVCQVRPMS